MDRGKMLSEAAYSRAQAIAGLLSDFERDVDTVEADVAVSIASCFIAAIEICQFVHKCELGTDEARNLLGELHDTVIGAIDKAKLRN